MKILVISDSHGNIANLKQVMGYAKKIKTEAVIHCGDWDNGKAVETVLSYNIPLYSVLGNADIGPDIGKRLELKSKRFDRVFLDLELENRRIGAVHNINNLVASIEPLGIVFFGHWHKQKDVFWKGIRAVNPDALVDDINFTIYDTTSNNITFFKHGQEK